MLNSSFYRTSAALLFTLPLLLLGCITSQTSVSSNIPYQVQQDINTSEAYEVNLKFEGHPDGNMVTANFTGRGSAEYPINDPFEGKTRQLMRTKFGDVTEDAENTVEIVIEDVQTENMTSMSSYKQKLSMKVRSTVSSGGNEESRVFERSTELVPSGETGSFREDDINNFLMQFVVAIDAYIDSNFGIE